MKHRSYKIYVATIFCLMLKPVALNAQSISRMEFKNQPITDILLVLAEASKTSIVPDETVVGNASFYFAETDIRTALKSFLGAQRLYMRESGGVFYISRVDATQHDLGLISVHAEDVEPSLILKTMSRLAGRTILQDPLPTIKMSVHIEKMTLQDAVNVIISRFPDFDLVATPMSLYVKKIEATGKKSAIAKAGTGIRKDSDGLYTFDFEQANFVEILDYLMTSENKEYVLMLRGDFSLSRMRHSKKQFGEALDLLLEQAGADYTERNGIYYFFEIQKKDYLKKLKDTTVVEVKNLPVQDLVAMLPQELSSGALFRIDKSTNSVIVTGSTQETKPLFDFIRIYDSPKNSKDLRVFSLMYMKAKDFLSLVPSRLFSTTPMISSDEYSFVTTVSQENAQEIERIIKAIDKRIPSTPIYLKFIKTEELLKMLPPSVDKDDIADSGYPGLVFFKGAEDQRRRFLLELNAIDRPKPQIQYDLLVLQTQSGFSINSDITGEAKPSEEDDATAIIGKFADLLSISFDVISEFGYTFAAELTAEVATSNTEVYADTKLTGLVGQDVKFQNTNTFRYRDSEIDPDDGTVQSTGVTRELTSGLLLSINGWASSDGMITMTITTTVSERGEVSDDTSDPPQTSERVVSTQVRTPSGVPIAITGLVQRNRSITLKRIPLLGWIPFVGKYFSIPTESDTKTEFSIYIVPRLMSDTTRLTDAASEAGMAMMDLYRSVRSGQ